MVDLLKKLFWYAISMTVYKCLFKKIGNRSIIIKPLKIKNGRKIFVDSNVIINDLSWLMAVDKNSYLYIGSETRIGHFAHIVSLKNIKIGKSVLIADKVYISDNTHRYDNIEIPIRNQQIDFIGEVEIGDHSWIGENVCIIGCKIGKHCIIGANSVITKEIPDYCVVVGAPGKIIKRYDFELKIWRKTNSTGEFID